MSKTKRRTPSFSPTSWVRSCLKAIRSLWLSLSSNTRYNLMEKALTKSWGLIPMNLKKWLLTTIGSWKIWPKWRRKCCSMKLWKARHSHCMIQGKVGKSIGKTTLIRLIPKAAGAPELQTKGLEKWTVWLMSLKSIDLFNLFDGLFKKEVNRILIVLILPHSCFFFGNIVLHNRSAFNDFDKVMI